MTGSTRTFKAPPVPCEPPAALADQFAAQGYRRNTNNTRTWCWTHPATHHVTVVNGVIHLTGNDWHLSIFPLDESTHTVTIARLQLSDMYSPETGQPLPARNDTGRPRRAILGHPIWSTITRTEGQLVQALTYAHTFLTDPDVAAAFTALARNR